MRVAGGSGFGTWLQPDLGRDASEEMASHLDLPDTMKICAALSLLISFRDRRGAEMRLLTRV